MVQSREELKISNGVLNQHLYGAWREGVFKGYGAKSLGYNKPHDCRFSEGKLIGKLMDAEQALWFNGGGSDRRLHVFADIGGEDAVAEVKAALEQRFDELTPKRKSVYGEMFGDYTVELGAVEYDGENHEGVIITVPVSKIPGGERGGFSGRIFGYVYNLFAIPAMTVKWGVPIAKRRWHVLDRPQNISPLK